MKSYQFGNIEAIMEPIKGPCPHGQTFDPEGDRGLVGLIARCTCCINLFRAKPKKQVPGTPIVGPFCRTCTSKRGRA
jgi:hypothetical protein